MKNKIVPYIALVPAVLLALCPPWNIALDCSINSLFWLWSVFLSGFLALAYFNTRVSIWLKCFVLWCFIGCFLSRAPYMSFTMFWSVIVCAYYYALCKKIQDWSIVKRTVQTLFFFIILLIIMQLFGKDTLLNFNQKTPIIIGTIGNPMILGTFVCVLAPFLIFTLLNWIPLILVALVSGSSGTVLAVMSGLGVVIWKKHPKWRALIPLAISLAILVGCATGDFSKRTLAAGRFPVWKRTVELTNKKPLGYGIGTFKLLFPIMSQDLESSKASVGKWEYDNTTGDGLAWRRTHNSYLQILFESGYIGIVLFLGWVISIVRKIENPIKLAGLVILGVVMVVHFPDRMIQAVLLLLMFLAYCEQREIPNGAR